MAKIFCWNARKGSFIERVSKTALSVTDVTFIKKEKGLVGSFNGTTSKIDTGSTTLADGLFAGADRRWSVAMSVNINYNDGGCPIARAVSTSGNRIFQMLFLRTSSPEFTPVFILRGATTSTSLNLDDGLTHLHIVTWDGTTAKYYLDGVYKMDLAVGSALESDSSFEKIIIGARQNGTALFMKGTFGDCKLFDHALSTNEITDEYKEFLQSQPTEKPIRGFVKPRPIDLSREKDTGLVAAYNMKAVNGVVHDISGNGYNGTVGGAINTKDGLLYSNFAKTVLTGTATGGAKPLELPNDFTICARLKPTSTVSSYIINNYQGTSPYVGQHILLHQDPFGSGFVFKLSVDDNVVNTTATTGVYDINKFYNICAVREKGSKLKIYINGSLAAEENDLTTGSVLSNFDWVIGNRSNGIVNGENHNGEINNVKFYNRAFTAEEAKDYNNSFITPTLVEDFSSYGVGSTPDKWIPVSGSYLVKEDAEKKWLENVTAGVIAIPNKQAYGMWELDFYKANSSTSNITFSAIDSAVNTIGSYRLTISNLEAIQLARAGVEVIAQTASAYISPLTWYRIRITRTTTGVFTLLIKGGNFTPTAGYDGWTLVSVLGGSGTNPVKDNAYTTSNYMVLDLDDGDRITNIKFLDGIIQ